ncbi:uncharacterized protein LOC121634589 [Melanotaenia boesemani]|uniref:uncharacterized protein LOC121634589 n=1 Tax=Melanotaenia boesemani TaxID=1250792 RepID=UPI001C04E7C6|nr:uncharacterized protein LOC121634589 [Melanotaenia boesemani]
MVRILVSHLIERFGENPTSGTKAALASSIVDQFPCLRDPLGTGYDAWFTPGRKHRPATGFLEERLRNIRKRLRSTQMRRTPQAPQEHPSMTFPEPNITGDRAIQLTEWLKNNIWPPAQVAQYMLETAVHRAQWIRANGNTPMHAVIAEFPRLVDTPGMISQDFGVLYPESSGRLTENWSTVFSSKLIQLAKKEKVAELPANIDLLPADTQGDVALLLLPMLFPCAPYKVGRKVFRPSSLEKRKAFIDVQPTGTNMVQYLSSAQVDYPFVLMLGEDNVCSQAFVIISGAALEQPSLLGAADVCFKSFYVLDCCYPKQCAQVWEFIQTVIFDIPGKESNTVKFMRAQLSGM